MLRPFLACASLVAVACLSACGSPAESGSSSAALGNSSGNAYPIMPNDAMTPGEKCSKPTEYRYAEHIPYCHRSVSTGVKRQIIQTYDAKFGYHIGSMNRGDFKIDHLIPLCMGGANEVDNLWPQHKSVYVHTDIIEADLCQLMSRGKMLQADAIAKIVRVKHHLDEADALAQQLEAALGH